MRIICISLVCGSILLSGCYTSSISNGRSGSTQYYGVKEAEENIVPTFKATRYPENNVQITANELLGTWLASQERETKRVVIGSKFNKRGNKRECVQFNFEFKDASTCEVTMFSRGKSYSNKFHYSVYDGKLVFEGRMWMLGGSEFQILTHSPSIIEIRHVDLNTYAQSRSVKSIYATSECRYDDCGCLYTTNLTGAPHNQKVMSVYSPLILKRVEGRTDNVLQNVNSSARPESTVEIDEIPL